jgi:hypothetical protein
MGSPLSFFRMHWDHEPGQWEMQNVQYSMPNEIS